MLNSSSWVRVKTWVYTYFDHFNHQHKHLNIWERSRKGIAVCLGIDKKKRSEINLVLC